MSRCRVVIACLALAAMGVMTLPVQAQTPPPPTPSPAFERAFLGEMDAATRAEVEKRATAGNTISGVIATTLLIASLAYSNSFPLMMAITLVLGFVVQGAQGGLSAVAATFYPTSIRSTGIGWCLGVGRIGSIVGPMLGGVMLKLDWTPREILLAGSIPALCAAAATFTSLRLGSNLAAETQQAGTVAVSTVMH